MKNFSFTAIIIAIVAPFVKLFPSWALKYTKKSNAFAEKFQLSAIKEENYLLSHPQSAEWIGERIWHLQTRKYFNNNKRARPELFEAFIKDINNSLLFDIAYEVAPEEAIKAKSYTLDSERIIKACNDNVNYLYTLADKQPQSFTVAVVRKLEQNRQEAYLSYLFTKCNWEKLMELDIILFEEAEKSKVAESCLSFLMGWQDFNPNLSAEQLIKLGDKYEKWCQNANPFNVANKMATYWCKNQNFQAIDKLLHRLIETEASSKRNDLARELLQMIPEDVSYYADDLILLLNLGIACPFAFKYLFNKDTANIDFNLDLCIGQKVENRISVKDFERFNVKQQEKFLIALAKDEVLSRAMLEKAPNIATQKELLDILEEKAQLKWFEPLLGCAIQEESLKILENYFKTGKIYGTLQDLTFKDFQWVDAFIEHNWYDEDHKIKLMQSIFIDEILLFMQKYGITQAQFEALLTSKNADLAPKAKLYMKKEKEADFEDGN